jgi:hypothetical protein
MEMWRRVDGIGRWLVINNSNLRRSEETQLGLEALIIKVPKDFFIRGFFLIIFVTLKKRRNVLEVLSAQQINSCFKIKRQ